MFKHIVECNRCSIILLDQCIYVVYSMSTSLKKVEITKYQYSNRSRGRHNDPPQVAPGGTGAPEHHLIKQNFNIMQNGHLENGKKETLHGKIVGWQLQTNHAAEVGEVHWNSLGFCLFLVCQSPF